MYDEGIRVRGNIKYVGVRIYTHTLIQQKENKELEERSEEQVNVAAASSQL